MELQKSNFKWNDAVVDQIKAFMAEDLSASQIAAKLGNAVSRNAVLGKIHRLGLKWPESRGIRIRVREPRPPRPPRPERRRKPPKIKLIDVVEPRTESAVGLMELKRHHCRAVLSECGEDGLAMYCGETVAEGRPWCGWHASRFCVPVRR